MGWFDESDEDGGDSKVNNSQCHFDEDIEDTNAIHSNLDDGDIDPLDAFMSGIDHQLQSSMETSIKKNDRLDVLNEEEATAHWDTKPLHIPSNTIFQDDQDSDDEDEKQHDDTTTTTTNEKSTAAASFLSSFQKAGSRTVIHKQQSHKTETNHDDYNDEDDGGTFDVHLLKERHRKVEPLDRCNHTLKTYPSFRKVLFQPENTEDGKQWRMDYDVSCSIDTVDPILSFADLESNSHDHHQGTIIPQTILEYLDENGYKEPTLVQSQCIPLALYGKDLLVTSHTGSGKTLAYLIPLVAHILDQPHIQPTIDGPIAIILTPTRELTRQIYIVGKKILKLVDAVAFAITGGMGTYEMMKDLKKGCEVVISTPGRWIDMIKKKASNMDRTTLVILDEADKMLDMGFETQVGSILENIRPDRQSWMFSATFGKKVERVAKRWLKDPIRVAVGKSNVSSEHVTQHIIVLPSYETKKIWMKEMLPILAGIGRLIIFVSSRIDCEEIAQEMRNSPDIGGKGYIIGSLHGDKHQSDRNSTLAAFRKGTITTLVATDVASRGLDVTDVMTVINFDPAKNLDSHIHRIGRCGRLSVDTDSATQEQKKGNAYTILLTPSDCNFANILLESFLREGRLVSDELMDLASKSKHFGGGGRHQPWNKSGLGYDDSDSYTKDTHRVPTSNYYGPSNESASKRPRWNNTRL